MAYFPRKRAALVSAGACVLSIVVAACGSADDGSAVSGNGALGAHEVIVAGVRVELDPNLPQRLARPEMLPLVASKQVSLEQLIEEGRKIWLEGNPLRGQPFSIPEALMG